MIDSIKVVIPGRHRSRACPRSANICAKSRLEPTFGAASPSFETLATLAPQDEVLMLRSERSERLEAWIPGSRPSASPRNDAYRMRAWNAAGEMERHAEIHQGSRMAPHRGRHRHDRDHTLCTGTTGRSRFCRAAADREKARKGSRRGGGGVGQGGIRCLFPDQRRGERSE